MKSSTREDQSHNYKTARQVALRHLSMQWYKDSKFELKHKVLMLNSKAEICEQLVSLSEIQETLL